MIQGYKDDFGSLDKLPEFDIDKLLQELTDDASDDVDVSISKDDIDTLRNTENLNALRVANKLKEEELNSNKQDRELRKSFSSKIYRLVCGYLFLVLVILCVSATSCLSLTIGDSVLIVLLSTTTVNVLGLLFIVVRYLFENKYPKGSKR